MTTHGYGPDPVLPQPDPLTIEKGFRFAIVATGASPATSLSPADVLRGVWKGRLAADDYELVIRSGEDSDESDG
jgi:hypothetical protein